MDANNVLIRFENENVDTAFVDTAFPHSLVELAPAADGQERVVVGTLSHLESYFAAVGRGNLDVVKEFHSGLDPYAMDDGGLTSPHLVSWSGHFAIVVWLLYKRGASMEKANSLGWHAVHYAAETYKSIRSYLKKI